MQDRIKVIGFGGQFGSGKDTAADYLADALNDEITRKNEEERKKELDEATHPLTNMPIYSLTWRRIAFANAVKQTFMDAFGVDRDFIEKWKREDDPPEGGFLKPIRKSLQFIGDGFRSIKDEIWIEIAFRDGYPFKIISDVRYLNEGRKISECGGIGVLVWRPGFENNDPNPSEAEIKPLIDWCLETNQNGQINLNVDVPPPAGLQFFDLFLRNDGTIEDLHEKTLTEVRSLMVQKWQM
tara:strand:- start:1497 stop:2213 length:717 start_codon:yes stop_codon:yes gene_type:complete